MANPNFVLLYVDSPKSSAAFYAELLGLSPVETSPTFAMFALESGLMLGLWSRHTAEPAPSIGAGGAELAFQVDNAEALDATYAAWSSRDVRVLQKPVDLDFGRTFAVLDPDGHRLRVFTAAEA